MSTEKISIRKLIESSLSSGPQSKEQMKSFVYEKLGIVASDTNNERKIHSIQSNLNTTRSNLEKSGRIVRSTTAQSNGKSLVTFQLVESNVLNESNATEEQSADSASTSNDIVEIQKEIGVALSAATVSVKQPKPKMSNKSSLIISTSIPSNAELLNQLNVNPADYHCLDNQGKFISVDAVKLYQSMLRDCAPDVAFKYTLSHYCRTAV